MNLGIVLIPDRETRERALEVNTILKGKLILSTEMGAGIPHLTLFQGAVSNEEEAVLKHAVDSLAAKLGTRSVPLAFSNIASWGGPFVFWDIDGLSRTSLFRHHLDVVTSFKSVTPENATPIVRGQGVLLSPEEESNVEKFGYPFVGAQFRPHITVAYEPESSVSRVAALAMLAGHVESVALVQTGAYGSVAKVIYPVTLL